MQRKDMLICPWVAELKLTENSTSHDGNKRDVRAPTCVLCALWLFLCKVTTSRIQHPQLC